MAQAVGHLRGWRSVVGGREEGSGGGVVGLEQDVHSVVIIFSGARGVGPLPVLCTYTVEMCVHIQRCKERCMQGTAMCVCMKVHIHVQLQWNLSKLDTIGTE